MSLKYRLFHLWSKGNRYCQNHSNTVSCSRQKTEKINSSATSTITLLVTTYDRAVLKWRSKVIMQLHQLHLPFLVQKSCTKFVNQWEAKVKPITPCTPTCNFSHALKLLVIIIIISSKFLAQNNDFPAFWLVP